jgi:hypothetical protein
MIKAGLKDAVTRAGNIFKKKQGASDTTSTAE